MITNKVKRETHQYDTNIIIIIDNNIKFLNDYNVNMGDQNSKVRATLHYRARHLVRN